MICPLRKSAVAGHRWRASRYKWSLQPGALPPVINRPNGGPRRRNTNRRPPPPPGPTFSTPATETTSIKPLSGPLNWPRFLLFKIAGVLFDIPIIVCLGRKFRRLIDYGNVDSNIANRNANTIKSTRNNPIMCWIYEVRFAYAPLSTITVPIETLNPSLYICM